MALFNAEMQRNYRRRRDADPQRREKYLEKERQAYQDSKMNRTRKSIKEMSAREQRAERKRWRIYKQQWRKKNKDKNQHTPPASPDSPFQSRQKSQSLKKKNKEKAKCCRDLKLLKNELLKEKKKVNMYKKRWIREKQKAHKVHLDDTPRTKSKKLLRSFSQKTVEKTLVFHHAQLRKKYRKCKKNQKHSMAKVIGGSIMKRYKFKTIALKVIGAKSRITISGNRRCISKMACKYVQQFFEREDNSRIITGIKNTVTKKKVKKQRRVLNDTLTNLHHKYLAEAKYKMGYSTFCRLRPFWVKFPTDTETCLCKLCENTKFLWASLQKYKFLSEDLDTILVKSVCDKSNKSCLYSECKSCAETQVQIEVPVTVEDLEWSEWKIRKEERKVKGTDKTVSFTVKETVQGTPEELMMKFSQSFGKYKKHIFNIQWQYRYLRERRSNLTDSECLLQVDFLQNFICKSNNEIQSMHFGASKRQISLHTGIYYVGKKTEQTFCTVSDELEHGPAGIWAHLSPILEGIKDRFPGIESVEFFSDGPTTQYKQKGNFYLFSTEIYGNKKINMKQGLQV